MKRENCYYNSPILIDWLKSLKDCVLPKIEWGEEDKKMFVNIKACLRNANKDYSAELDWLRSLKPQNQSQWKPSESDIRVLEQVIDGTANPINYHATLHAVLEKLKKLREE